MGPVNSEQTVGEVVAAAPLTARIFQRHGIDFCCGGKVPIADACRDKGVDADALIAEIEQLVAEPAPETTDWTAQPLGDLIDHILGKHHEYLNRELPRVVALAKKVDAVHGARHPEIFPALSRHVLSMAQELDAHMMKEEQVLFPAVRAIETGGSAGAFGHCGGIDAPISVMEWEHEEVGRVLADMRRITSNYTPPADACNSFRALYAGLEDMEQDLHVHIHLENNVLHPRALALSRATCQH